MDKTALILLLIGAKRGKKEREVSEFSDTSLPLLYDKGENYELFYLQFAFYHRLKNLSTIFSNFFKNFFTARKMLRFAPVLLK